MTVRSFLGQRQAGPINCATCHRDGTVTFHDPLKGQWVECATSVPVHALAVLPADEEARVLRHLHRHMVAA